MYHKKPEGRRKTLANNFMSSLSFTIGFLAGSMGTMQIGLFAFAGARLLWSTGTVVLTSTTRVIRVIQGGGSEGKVEVEGRVEVEDEAVERIEL